MSVMKWELIDDLSANAAVDPIEIKSSSRSTGRLGGVHGRGRLALTVVVGYLAHV